MKRIKGLLALVLSLAVVFTMALSTSAFAASAKVPTAGSKTVAKCGTYAVETIDNNTRYPFDAIIYQPKGVTPKIGIMFYPGMPVDYRDYGPILKNLASAGYLVVSCEFPLDTGALNVTAAEEYVARFPNIDEWFLAGHSHGGGCACVEASLNIDQWKGLILMASIPTVLPLPDDYPVLMFHATEDGAVPKRTNVILCAEIGNTDLTKVTIKGGNHAQFGDYGVQSNDNPSTISAEKQQTIVTTKTLKWLAKYQ